MTAPGMPPLTALAGLVSRIAQIMQSGDDPAARSAAAASVDELRALVHASGAAPVAPSDAVASIAPSTAADTAGTTAASAVPGTTTGASPSPVIAPAAASGAAPGVAPTTMPAPDAAPGFDLAQISNALAIFAQWLRAPTPDLELRAAHAMAELQTALGPLVGWDPAREDAERRVQYRREARAALDNLFPDGLGIPSPFDKPKT